MNPFLVLKGCPWRRLLDARQRLLCWIEGRQPHSDRSSGSAVAESPVMLKPQKTPEFGLPVTAKPNKQRQPLNLDGHLTQMAGDLRRWWVHTLTDQLLFSFQAKVFIAGNKQGVERGFEIQGKVNWIKKQLQHSHPGQWS